MRMISHCGLLCSECPAFIAARDNNEELRIKTAKNWSKMYQSEIKPESINCHGCLSKDNILFAHCFECEIRACSNDRKLENCAHCPEYACENLKSFFEFVPDAKEILDEINKK
ncbi:MAG: DUF3795 domain-containing protein [Candidatus Cloacimonetes bacterium]|nr:DUF3795 domain-containing protein [Candidatus Cloacimonadota bacterium]